MTLTYNLLGKYIHQVDERNKDLITESVLGINIDKFFMPSVANVIGTDLSNYKLLNKYRFACNPMHVGRDCRLPVSLYQENVPAIVSPAYFTFEINNSCELDPEYLMLCFRRPLFDKFCTFKTDASVRGGISWDDLCSINIPIPSTIEEQQKIVSDYKVITDRIEVLKRLNTNLEKQISTIFCEKFKPLSSDMQGSYELKSILSFNNGYAFSSNDYIDKGSYKIVTIGNVYDGYVDTTKVNYLNKISDQIRKLSLLNVGDIVISLTGEIGRTALIKEENLLLNQRVARIVPNKEIYRPFVYALFRQEKTKEFLEEISKGTAQLNLSPVELSKTRVNYNLSDIEEFGGKTNVMLLMINDYSKEIALLEKLKLELLNTLSIKEV